MPGRDETAGEEARAARKQRSLRWALLVMGVPVLGLLLLGLVREYGVDGDGPLAPPEAAGERPGPSSQRSVAGTPGDASTPPAGDPDSIAARAAQHGVPPASRAPAPASLAGTQVDGRLAVSADGHFLATADTRRLFDYFFSASGEEPEAVLRGRIVLHLLAELPPAAAEEAIAVLDRYVAYRAAAREATSRDPGFGDLGQRLQWTRELRRAQLGEALSRDLFAEEEQVAEVDLARRRVLQDDSLDEAERAERLRALESELPPRIASARQRARAPVEMRREVSALREAGAGDAEIFAAREARFGAEAAERLAALDRERAAWSARLDAFRAESSALVAAADLSEPEREAAVAALLEERFTPLERKRVRALEQIR